MLPRLFGVLALLGLAWIARRLAAPAARAGGRAVPQTEPMVRDRICDTYVPRAAALVEIRAGKEHFFCSERCRERFLAGPS